MAKLNTIVAGGNVTLVTGKTRNPEKDFAVFPSEGRVEITQIFINQKRKDEITGKYQPDSEPIITSTSKEEKKTIL